MTEKMMESIITELVVTGGDARGKALEAVRAAKNQDMDRAEALLRECNAALTEAHNFQTTFIQEALNSDQEGGVPGGLLMVHGQDHLMDAMTVRDLAKEMVEMYRLIHEMRTK